ncbi:hypothetical protein OV208_15435 [Corallococcus sp. bb12-1]|uniref:hypothetical protein n=1 Tax=Corallococcus sp. bb12-1 TaxID=2996784 RepID=UPI0022710137|nr:hypothetical protein [Corallococcus sp. bb12-1]MCY1042716.1 hypothetical protein [Corallococcus sp. bb12-1]
MSAQADRLAAKSLALLKRFGQAATLTQRAAGVYDVATSKVVTSATEHPVQVVVQADSGQDKEGDGLTEGGTARADRRKLLVAADGLPVTPAPGDTVGPLEGRTWRVLKTDPPTQLQGTPILYTLRVSA